MRPADSAPDRLGTHRRDLVAALGCAGILLSACTVVGPTIPVQPGAGGNLATLQADRRACMAQTDARVQPIASRPGSSAARIQVLYNEVYGRCMAARGNVVSAAATPSTGRGDAPGVGATGLTDPDSIAARQSLASRIDGFRQACAGERISVSVTEAVLSPSADARVVELSTPEGGNCFGQPGTNAYLVLHSGSAWRTLLSAEPGSIKVLNTRRNGYADLELHSLGLCVYDYRWDGSRYVRTGAKDCATAAPPSASTLSRAIRRN